MHRLGRFAAAHPDIDLRISAAMHHVDFAREEVDVAVRHGDGDWPGLHVENLCAEELFPVCSPQLIVGLDYIATSLLPTIATFRDWLRSEAADDARHLKIRVPEARRH